MSGLHVDRKSIPVEIRNFVKSVAGIDLTAYEVIQTGSISVGMPWHIGCSDYYQLFRITPESAETVGFSFSRHGTEGDGDITGNEITGTTNIPSGFVMVRVSTYPKSVRIYTADNATKVIPEMNGITLTDDEATALLYAKAYKAFARPKYADSVYASLIEKKLMKANRSITLTGKNILATGDVKNQLTEISKSKRYLPSF
jgi:hypothetical protein